MSTGERWLCRSAIGACSATPWKRARAVSPESRNSSFRNAVATPQRSDRHRAESAVDDELAAGDEAARVACEKECRPGELLDVAEAPERRVIEDLCAALGCQDPAVLLRREEARDEHVAADAERAPLARQV